MPKNFFHSTTVEVTNNIAIKIQTSKLHVTAYLIQDNSEVAFLEGNLYSSELQITNFHADSYISLEALEHLLQCLEAECLNHPLKIKYISMPPACSYTNLSAEQLCHLSFKLLPECDLHQSREQVLYREVSR